MRFGTVAKGFAVGWAVSVIASLALTGTIIWAIVHYVSTH